MDHRPARCRGFLLVLLPLLLASLPAGADVLATFGPSARSISMANAGAALVDDYAAVFSCPAGMAFGKPSLGLGFLGGPNRLQVRLAPRPAGYDPPELHGNSPVIPYRYRLTPRQDPDHPPDLLGFGIGASAAAGMDWLRLGVVAFLPLAGMGRQFTYFSDEREQYFTNTLHSTLYGDRLIAQQVAFGLAIRPLRWLALGGALRFTLAPKSNAVVLIPDSGDQRVQEMNMRATTGISTSPMAGVAARLWDDRLRLSLTFRDDMAMTLQGRNEVQVKGFEGTEQYPFYQPMDFVISYSPRQLVFSSGLHNELLAIAIDLTWTQWSRYRDDHDALAGFEDTVAASLGAEYLVWDRLRLRTGLGVAPSPVPDQTGRTSYVDNDMILLGLGGAYDLDVGENNVELSLYGQLQIASHRETTKKPLAQHPVCKPGVTALCDEVPDDLVDPRTGKPFPEAAGLQTGNPGFPGYSSGGWLAVAGLQLVWRYR